jgi:hypothetical protein
MTEDYIAEGENLAAGEIYPSQTYRLHSIAVHPNFRFSPAADRLGTTFSFDRGYL